MELRTGAAQQLLRGSIAAGCLRPSLPFSLACCTQISVFLSHPFGTVVRVVFCYYSRGKYVSFSGRWIQRIVALLLFFFNLPRFTFLLAFEQLLHALTMKNLTVGLLGEELGKLLLIAERLWKY